MDPLAAFDITSTMLVHWNHSSQDPRVELLCPDFKDSLFRKMARVEYLEKQKKGRENVGYSWSNSLFRSKKFIEADLIHLQIVQGGVLDAKTISQIFKKKPTIWTWHDPWPLTGHCIYPMDCGQFSRGCGSCPDLRRGFQVSRDHTKSNKSFKSSLFDSGYTLHVASNWFSNFISSQASHVLPTPKVLPFGIDVERFSPRDKKQARSRLGISQDSFVIGIRAVKEPQKNFVLFQRAIQMVNPNLKITVVTIQDKSLLKLNSINHDLVEIGWTHSAAEIQDFFSSLDIFIMPSLYETFGLMALEAAAYGVPTVAVTKTAVDEVVNLRNNGYPITGRSSLELAKTIEGIFFDQNQLRIKSISVRALVEAKYKLSDFLFGLKELYVQTIENYFNGKN